MASPTNALNAQDVRPFTSFNFVVLIEVKGVTQNGSQVCSAAFSECDGLEMTMEPKTIRAGGRNTGPVHLSGPLSYGQLTLKRGMTSNFDLWNWFEQMYKKDQSGYRTSATVVMRGADQSDQAVFQLTGCLPIKLKAPGMNAKDGIVAIEEIQIAYETLLLKSNKP